ncbi:thiamine phosphate synthase [Olivibacter sp. XZL3]|uniref:thiamine phosphate synthase n=1 Tax=Olivibacter sp. XZL3 TaxID=1735116 RepID=UPI00106544E2|nr:thiamine phosphate synthase [Olivibacter sp. XZL3]
MVHFKKNIARLHYITQATPSRSILDQVHTATAGGIQWIQFRSKSATDDAFREEAMTCLALAKRHLCTFVVNDRVDIAKEIGADGVHIGKEDISPRIARELLGPEKIIGCTANTLDDIIHLSGQPIDYIGLGPFRFTSTKEKLSPILGLAGYQQIIKEALNRNISIPVIAIGGIRFEDIGPLFQTGIQGIAVSGLISNSNQPEKDCRELLKQTEVQSCQIP